MTCFVEAGGLEALSVLGFSDTRRPYKKTLLILVSQALFESGAVWIARLSSIGTIVVLYFSVR